MDGEYGGVLFVFVNWLKVSVVDVFLQVSLKDADISLRRRALDLLFAMCHESNAEVRPADLLSLSLSAFMCVCDTAHICVLHTHYASTCACNATREGDGQHVILCSTYTDVSHASLHRSHLYVTCITFPVNGQIYDDLNVSGEHM